jgi:hypothetical protein
MRRVALALLIFASFLPQAVQRTTSVAADGRGLPDLIQQLVVERHSQRVHCETDGSEGRRIVAVYLYPDGQPNDYASHEVDISRTLSVIDEVWDDAADPYDQHPRWACDPNNFKPFVIQSRGPAVGADGAYTFADVLGGLKRENLVSPDRIYLVFADHIGAYPYGGQATVDADDRSGSGNLNNIGPAYAMIDAAKSDWNMRILWGNAMHELIHALGGVQCSAPHSTCPARESGRYHCWDGTDVMCLDDNGSYYRGSDGIRGTADDRAIAAYCDPQTPADQIDCGRDDYFNVAPAAGSYLATHWNLTRSSFVTPLLVD